jgi:tetratricopeptide (TPR) repeat protein
LLTDTLTDQLADQRALYNLPSPDPALTLQEAVADMETCARQPNNLLIGYCHLYYRYIRADLDLSVVVLDKYLGQEKRTRQRHVDDCLGRLVGVLIRLETAARAAYRRERCLLALPQFTPFPLKTGLQTADHMATQIAAGQLQHVLICGAPGLGKSTLAVQIGEKLVKQDAVDEAAWLNLSHARPGALPSVGESLAGLICETLTLPDEPQRRPSHILRDYLAFLTGAGQRLLLILDGADDWSQAIQELWIELSHCVLIVTARPSLAGWGGAQVECSPLEAEEAFLFLEHLAKQQPSKKKKAVWRDEVFYQIWQAVGGNPAALKRAFQLLAHLPPAASLSTTRLRDYYLNAWEAQSAIACQFYILVAALAAGQEAHYEQLVAYTADLFDLGQAETSEIIIGLIDAGLLESRVAEPQAYTYQPTVEAERALHQSPLFAEAAQQLAEAILSRAALPDADGLACTLLSYGLYLPRPLAASLELAKLARQKVTRSRQWQGWLAVLEWLDQHEPVLAQDKLWVWTEEAIALRINGRFDDALAKIVTVVQYAQQRGETWALVKGLTEESTVWFYRGDAELAAQKAAEAYETALASHADEPMLEKAAFAAAQALSQFDPAQARPWLDRIKQRGAPEWDLIARIELSTDRPKAALAAAQKSVALLNIEDPDYPRSVGLLARALAANGALSQAIDYFQQALNLLHHRQDGVGLARMHNNLGVAYLQQDVPELAQEQFEQALALHTALQDTHGAAVAQQNLTLAIQAAQERQNRPGGPPKRRLL